MSKAGRLRRKRAKARRAKVEARPRRQSLGLSNWLSELKIARRGASVTWAIVLGVVTLLAGLSQIYFSAWRMSVTPGETLNASDPFSTMFVLYNEGQFPMHGITFGCRARDVVYDTSIQVRGNLTIPTDPFNVARLEANARTSTPCRVPPGVLLGRPLSVDVSVLVSYRSSFSLFRSHSEFRFLARPNDKGGYSWTPMGQ